MESTYIKKLTVGRKFNISFSVKAYTEKPDEKTIPHMCFREECVTTQEFADKIAQGHSFCGIFRHNGETFDTNTKQDKNFLCTNYIGIDCDHMGITMEEMLERIPVQPTIAYVTPSNGLEGMGYRYRLIYMLDSPVFGKEEVQKTWDLLVKDWLGLDVKVSKDKIERATGENKLGIQIDDRAGRDCSRYFNGAAGCNIILSDTLLSVSGSTDTSVTEYDEPVKFTDTAPTFFAEYNSISRGGSFAQWDEWFIKWADEYGHYNVSSDLDFNENGVATTEGYIEIKYRWTRDEEGKASPLKVPIGERHKAMNSIAVRLRMVNPDITLEGLTYALWNEVYHHFALGDGINAKEVSREAVRIHRKKFETLHTTYKPKEKFKVSGEYCEEHNTTKSKVVAEERSRRCAEKRREKDEKIGILFDVNKTDKENIKELKAHDIEVSASYIRGFRERNGIDRRGMLLEKLREMLKDGKSDLAIMLALQIPRGSYYRLKKEALNPKAKERKPKAEPKKLRDDSTFLDMDGSQIQETLKALDAEELPIEKEAEPEKDFWETILDDPTIWLSDEALYYVKHKGRTREQVEADERRELLEYLAS